uniref:Uncharacterized protein n=1 Tax=Glossina pallidipes TaxID=7398 RepID=A0A1A9Z139_GLOPL
ITSHKTSLPSASVLRISTVFPDNVSTISPGRHEDASSMFSQHANTPMILRFKFNFNTVCIIPNTAAAPHISYFISSILCDGFNEIPPESNVNPFPIKTIGFSSVLSLPLYLIIEI